MHNHTQRFQQRALNVRYVVGKLVAPFRRVSFVPLYGTVVRIYASELDILAKVVAAVEAEETCAAGDTWFDSYAVA